MNTLRIIGGAIWPIISGVIMQIFLVPVIVNGEEQLFPSVVAFNLIFFICMILGIVLTIEVIFMKVRYSNCLQHHHRQHLVSLVK